MRISVANDKRIKRELNISFTESLNDLIYFQIYSRRWIIAEFIITVPRIDLIFYRRLLLRLKNRGFKECDSRFLSNLFQNRRRRGRKLLRHTTRFDVNYYLLKISITVSEEPAKIPLPSLSTIEIPILGFSLPIFYDFDISPPVGQIVLESNIPIFPDLRLDYGYVSDYLVKVE